MADTLSSVSDAELLTILDQLQQTLANKATDYPGITTAMKDDLATIKDLYYDKLLARATAQAAAKSATIDKDAVRRNAEVLIRSVRNINKAGGVDEVKITALGIPKGDSKASPTATVPAGAVDTSVRLRHTIRWTDAATLDNKRKPRGAMGVEIWFKLDGPPPTDEKDCSFLTLDSATPYLAEYSGTDAGKMAHYLLRWRMADGSVGGWGETVSATITG